MIELGNFTLHSGDLSTWRINADALTDEQLDSLAAWAVHLWGAPGRVIGVPRGGLRFANAIFPHCTQEYGDGIWIVDDVFTTGKSIMEVAQRETSHLRYDETVHAVVIFARKAHNKPLPLWLRPLFVTEVPMYVG